MTIDERLDRLTGIVETLAASVTAHDTSIEGLARAAAGHDSVIKALAGAAAAHSAAVEAHDRQIGVLIEVTQKNQDAMLQMQREWQAYLNTLRRQ